MQESWCSLGPEGLWQAPWEVGAIDAEIDGDGGLDAAEGAIV
jgi:hypothetical protein